MSNKYDSFICTNKGYIDLLRIERFGFNQEDEFEIQMMSGVKIHITSLFKNIPIGKVKFDLLELHALIIKAREHFISGESDYKSILASSMNKLLKYMEKTED